MWKQSFLRLLQKHSMNSILFCWPLRMFARNSWVDRIVLSNFNYESFPYSCLLDLTYRSPRVGDVTVFYSFDTTNIWYVTKQLGKWTQRFSVVCFSLAFPAKKWHPHTVFPWIAVVYLQKPASPALLLQFPFNKMATSWDSFIKCHWNHYFPFSRKAYC